MSYELTNTEKRRKETEALKDLHPKVKNVVFDVKKNFYDSDGANLSDRYELILKTSDKQVRGLKGRDAMERHEIENGGFMFSFFQSSMKIQDRFTTITPQDIARLMYLGTFVAYETGRLQSNNGKKAFNKKDVEKLIGMSTKHFNNLFNRYVAEGIIKEGQDGQLFGLCTGGFTIDNPNAIASCGCGSSFRTATAAGTPEDC